MNAKPPTSSTKKKETPKLTDIFKKKTEEKKEEVEIDDSKKRNAEFNREQVDEALKLFIDTKNVSSSFLSLLKNEFKIQDRTNIELQLKNSVEKKFLGEIEVELVRFMRDELKNDHILITSAFNQEETKRTAYTNAEIFEEMLAKKPELLRLKDELGLDTEF